PALPWSSRRARVGERVVCGVSRRRCTVRGGSADRADPVDACPARAAGRRPPCSRLCLSSAMATELKPVYLITGGDRPKIQRALRRLRDRIGEEGVELLSALESGGDDAVAACNSMGLLGGGRRLVVVEEVERWKAPDVKAVATYLASPAPETVLALVAAELKKDSPLGKACAKVGDVLVYDVPKRRVPE